MSGLLLSMVQILVDSPSLLGPRDDIIVKYSLSIVARVSHLWGGPAGERMGNPKPIIEGERPPEERNSLFAARLLLFWPLTLHPRDDINDVDAISGIVTAQASSLGAGSPWRSVADPVAHIRRAPDPGKLGDWQNAVYAEALYFHEFVQDFLYRRHDGRDSAPPFHLFAREDVKQVEVTFGNGATGEVKRQLDVERLNLYLFRTGAAILVLEVAAKGKPCGWTLAEFQTFHDSFRRLYAPFFYGGREAPLDFIPRKVCWLDNQGKRLEGLGRVQAEWSSETAACDVEPFVEKPDNEGRRWPPLFGHWRFLLADALPLRPTDNRERHFWRPVSDERLPTMATLSVTPMEEGKPLWSASGDSKKKQIDECCVESFQKVREGDLMRLCFADGAGEDDYPYDQGFLEKSWDKNTYKRFQSQGTLYLFSGYAFVAIGAGAFFDNVASEHVRRHYFQMGLLLHFEKAALLSFSAQISRAVQRFGGVRNRERFAQAMSGIQEQFLHFTHRFRFTGLSNQLQAGEMFAQWRDRLELGALYEDVGEELRAANAFLDAQEQKAQTRAAARLSQVATIGVVFGLAVGTLGMNVVFTEHLLPELMGEGGPSLGLFAQLRLVALVFGGFSLVGIALLTALSFPCSRSLRIWQHWLRDLLRNRVSGVLLLLSVLSFLVWTVLPHG